jgi:hypothetical protein
MEDIHVFLIVLIILLLIKFWGRKCSKNVNTIAYVKEGFSLPVSKKLLKSIQSIKKEFGNLEKITKKELEQLELEDLKKIAKELDYEFEDGVSKEDLIDVIIEGKEKMVYDMRFLISPSQSKHLMMNEGLNYMMRTTPIVDIYRNKKEDNYENLYGKQKLPYVKVTGTGTFNTEVFKKKNWFE